MGDCGPGRAGSPATRRESGADLRGDSSAAGRPRSDDSGESVSAALPRAGGPLGFDDRGTPPPPRSVRRLAALRLAAGLVVLAAAPASAAQPKTVLILISESMEMPAGLAVVREVVAALRTSGGAVNAYAESLERSRFPGDDQRLLALFRQRYSVPKPDLVVAICEPAVQFVLKHRDEPFLRDVPLLYGFVDQRMALAFGSPPATAGVALDSDLLEFTDLALKLHPTTRRVVVVGGVADFDRGWQASFQRIAPQLESRGAIRYLTEGSLPELLGELATLPDDSLIVYLSMSRDRDGSVFVPRDVLDLVHRVSRVPVYGPSSTYVGRGAVGGPVMDIEAHGRELGAMAARILAGAAPSSLKPGVTKPRMIFDAGELSRFGISEASLPNGAEVLYRQNEWSIHRGWIVAVFALLSAQTALIVTLVVQRRKRTALQQSLDSRLGFGTLLSDVSTALNAVPLRSLDGTIRSALERTRYYFDVDSVAILDASTRPATCRTQSGSDSGIPGHGSGLCLCRRPVRGPEAGYVPAARARQPRRSARRLPC